MRALVDGDELVHLDLGVPLRGRERGVAEQLLDRAQIPARREQVRHEAVAERVRRSRTEARGDREARISWPMIKHRPVTIRTLGDVLASDAGLC